MITCGDVNYDYMPETEITGKSKEIILDLTKKKRNMFKKKAKKLLGQTRTYFHILSEF